MEKPLIVHVMMAADWQAAFLIAKRKHSTSRPS
jgi:hypothetical protein